MLQWKAKIIPCLYCLLSDIFFTAGCYTDIGKSNWYPWAAFLAGTGVTIVWAFMIIPLNPGREILFLSMALGLVGAIINAAGASFLLKVSPLELVGIFIVVAGTALYMYGDYRRG